MSKTQYISSFLSHDDHRTFLISSSSGSSWRTYKFKGIKLNKQKKKISVWA